MSVRAETWRRELLKKPWRAPLTGLLIMSCSVCSLSESRTTSPWVAAPTMGWILQHNHQEKAPPGLPTAQFGGGIFISLGSLLQNGSYWHHINNALILYLIF